MGTGRLSPEFYKKLLDSRFKESRPWAGGKGPEQRTYENIGRLESLYVLQQDMNPDQVLGLYGEEARAKQSLGSAIAASGSDVSGTYNKFPLYALSSDYASKRIAARNAFEQAKIMNLLRITDALGGQNQMLFNQYNTQRALQLQKEAQETKWYDFLPNVNFAGEIPIPKIGG